MEKPLTEEEAKTKGTSKAFLIVGILVIAIIVFLLFKPDFFQSFSI